MKFAFNNILVPVDFTINTEVAVAKALALADTEGGLLHLLHVRKNKVGIAAPVKENELAATLEQWQHELETYQPGLRVRWWIAHADSITSGIVHHAVSHGCDLVVVGKNRKDHWFRFTDTIVPRRVAAQTGIPVLTARPGALQTKVRTIVVPVSETLPLSKMAALSLLCTRMHPTIHLVAFGTNAAVSTENAASLLQVYQWVRSHLRCPVEYALLDGSLRSRSLLRYTQKVDADLLLVYPEQETRVDIWNRHISDVLPAQSKVQVLALQPETEFSTT
ncbi:Nucleotide-binding universal stress protein, UspA family [Cnuella takakiae]|uniref:Nucleotide-binding universal stress protein, UspA family n=1 Tax=Cnuella takakiae TaxID=1302690 RepID=A0A1M5IX67_9BACT|nr:universal stress protein [Cnuella takakiae]OLY91427.1 hypothetical protein BUE76_05560 [Cnuella takakiae]SHG32861.1 Nucleotide-binding universal stress protein, UspA family [Cnuella takakiae]